MNYNMPVRRIHNVWVDGKTVDLESSKKIMSPFRKSKLTSLHWFRIKLDAISMNIENSFPCTENPF
jgi:hypothetical protein